MNAGLLPLWALPIGVLAVMTATGLGVVLGYHRLLTHRAARVHPLIERALVVFGMATGTPVQWVGNHRFHHAHVDTPADPHSPSHHGFWVAHSGWYIGTRSVPLCVLYTCAGPMRTVFDAFWRPRSNQEHIRLAKDVAADPFYAWLSRPGPYAAVLLGWMSLVWVAFIVAWGPLGAAAMAGVHFVAYALGDGVNSVGHLFGARPWDAPGEHHDQSRDSALLALITFGDGWHHSHHRFPGSIRCGLRPGQIDVAYLVVKALEVVGLASELREPARGQLPAASP